MNILAKLSTSGTLQIAVLLVASLITMLVLQQCGHGYADSTYTAFVYGFLWYIAGRRAEASGRTP